MPSRGAIVAAAAPTAPATATTTAATATTTAAAQTTTAPATAPTEPATAPTTTAGAIAAAMKAEKAAKSGEKPLFLIFKAEKQKKLLKNLQSQKKALPLQRNSVMKRTVLTSGDAAQIKRKMKKYYQIDGVNEHFASLSDAKHHLFFYTENDFRQLRNACGGCVSVIKFEGDVATSSTPVRISEAGRVSFSKTANLVHIEGTTFIRCTSWSVSEQRGVDHLIAYVNGRAYDCLKAYRMRNGVQCDERYKIRGEWRKTLRAAVLDAMK